MALLVIFGIHAARAGDAVSRGMAAVALVCLVCFLFPVISMTDDLNSSGPALLEPSKLKKLMPSTQAVLTLLPWLALQKPQETSWPAPERQLDVSLPLQEVLTFSLSRRPPPALLALA
ncbi:MAG TPA: hypothetical protein VI488_03080 [Candidatus Angelobacter sp.]